MKSELLCYNCKKSTGLDLNQNVSRHEECPHCYANMHCCKMCTYYDQSSYNECREPMANRILEKEKANFCDYYSIKGSKDSEKNANDLLKAASSLFKD